MFAIFQEERRPKTVIQLATYLLSLLSSINRQTTSTKHWKSEVVVSYNLVGGGLACF